MMIKKIANGFYDYCIDYCKQQSWEYAIGVNLVDFTPSDFADYIDAKVNDIDTDKMKTWKEWVKKKVDSCSPLKKIKEIDSFNRYFQW